MNTEEAISLDNNVVITGMGVISPIGMGKDGFWQGLEQNRGIKPIALFDVADLPCRKAAEIAFFNAKEYLSQRGLKHLSRSAQFACAASALALEDADLDLSGEDLTEVGVILGTAFGNVNSMVSFDKEGWIEGPRFVNPMMFPNTVVNSPAGYVSIFFGITGLNVTISNRLSSGLDALHYAAECLMRGEAQIALAGGYEELSELVHLGFLKAGQIAGSHDTTNDVPKPMDRKRNGFVLGEGAAVLILERLEHARSRGARILGEIAGYGRAYIPASLEANDVLLEAKVRSMRQALDSSGLHPKAIDFISLSANGSVQGDRLEALAIGEIFGNLAEKIPATAIKSKIGECFGASGVFQTASAVLSMEHHLVLGTTNFEESDPNCPLGGLSAQNRSCQSNAALINSFEVGHSNSSLVVKSSSQK